MKRNCILLLIFFVLSFTPKTIRAEESKTSTVIFHGNRNVKKIALTFDADMTKSMKKELDNGTVSSWYNKKVIETLEKTNTKATLFLTGMWIELYKKEAESFAKNPLFELGNHSYSHPSFNGRCFGLSQIKTIEEKKLEIEKTQKLLEEITHKKNKWFRFPGGCFSDNDLNIVEKLGLKVVQWDVVSKDAFSRNSNTIIDRVVTKSQNGSIVVMHLNGGPNAPETGVTLPYIINNLKKRGFEFVTLSELLH